MVPRISELDRIVARNVTRTWGPWLAGLWLAVSGGLLARTLIGLVRVRRWLGAAPAAPPEVQTMAQEIARRLGLGAAPGVWFVPGILSPALWALGRRARLLVPEALWARLEPDQRAALLAHELAHLRRRDHWIRPLELWVGCCYWWLPIVRWMRKSLRDAEEECCDAWVVWLLPESKAAYAHTLLRTVEFLSEARPAPLPATTGFGTVATLKARLSRIMKGSRPRSLSRAGSAWVTALALGITPLAWREGRNPGVPLAYRIVDLGPFEPIAINNVGQIVGNPLSPGKPRAHRWDRGSWTALADRDDVFVTATDINDRGQITGWYEIFLEPARRTVIGNAVGISDARYTPRHAFRTAPDRGIELPADDLGTLGGDESRGLAINNAGQVAGISSLDPGTPPGSRDDRAFRTAPDRPIDPRNDLIDRFDAQEPVHFVKGVSLNNRGDVVISTDFGGRRPALHAAPGGTIDSVSAELGPDDRPGLEVMAKGINDRGQVAALVSSWWGREPQDVPVSFSLAPGRRIDLQTDRLPRPFVPKAINNNGLILGAVSPLPWDPHPAHAITEGRRLQRLEDFLGSDPGWRIWRAADINDRNQVIGVALGPDRTNHGVLLEPVRDPSPCFWIVGGTMLAGLALGAGRLRRPDGFAGMSAAGRAVPGASSSG